MTERLHFHFLYFLERCGHFLSRKGWKRNAKSSVRDMKAHEVLEEWKAVPSLAGV